MTTEVYEGWRVYALFILMFIALFAISMQLGCGATKPEVSEAVDDINAIRFVRHQNGMCFGVVHYTTYGGYNGVSITQVESKACPGAER